MSDESEIQHSKIWAKVVGLVLCTLIVSIAAYNIADRVSQNQRFEQVKKLVCQ